MHKGSKRPEITVFAGPNGSGKSTLTLASPHVVQPYINADEIKHARGCSVLEAAQTATDWRLQCIDSGQSFSFETVLSTVRNIDLLREAKRREYFIRGFFVLTIDVQLNILRVNSRVDSGGHDVPSDKIRSRFIKSVANVPEFIDICDVCHIYDNSGYEPNRIFKKKNNEITYWARQYWPRTKIEKLVGFKLI